MSKGVSKEVINYIIILIVVILFLALVILFFRGQIEEFVKIITDIFRKAIKKG